MHGMANRSGGTQWLHNMVLHMQQRLLLAAVCTHSLLACCLPYYEMPLVSILYAVAGFCGLLWWSALFFPYQVCQPALL